MESTFISSARPLAVITNASSGIGYELAKVFAKNNFDLLVVSEDVGIMDASNSFLQFGGSVDSIQANLATYDGVEKLYRKIQTLEKPVDSLVLNTGADVNGKFLKNNLEEELNLIQLNIVSLVHLTKRVLPEMVDAGQGHILLTSPFATQIPKPIHAVYCASKAFIQSFADQIGRELQDTGIGVTSFQPVDIETNTKVAEHAFAAMMIGRDHVVAGSFKNKIHAAVTKFISSQPGANIQSASTKT
jgi:short-subunit dehydrogenase